MMTSAQVVETSVNVITNSPSQDYTHPDDHNLPTYTTFMYPLLSSIDLLSFKDAFSLCVCQNKLPTTPLNTSYRQQHEIILALFYFEQPKLPAESFLENTLLELYLSTY